MVRSRTDDILGTDRRLIKNVVVRDPRHNTDHYMVLGCFPGAPLATKKGYQGGTETMASGATGGAIEGGHTLCGSTESRTEKGAAGGETKRLGLGAWRLSR